MASLASPIVAIITYLWPGCARHTRYLCKLQQNMILLRNAMKELKDERNDMQRRVVEAEADPNEPKKERTDSVSGWLQSVEVFEGEVEGILKKAGEQLSRARCVGVCCPPNKCWSNYKLGKSIAKKIPLAVKLKEKGHFQEETYSLPLPSVQDMNLESTVGMESMFDKVWRLVTSTDDKPVKIMGLFGHGGVGKTTLLKKINNEYLHKISTGEHGFDHIVIFVGVSKPINYEAIQKTIGKRLGLSDLFQGDGDGDGDGDESSRAHKIFNQLKNKKNFVLLLDNIWERVDLQRIGIPLGNSSSKVVVIFTTRNEQVCGLMEATYKFKVECLLWDKAWSLFQEKVGEEALTCCPRARELAKDVAERCGGLPLALITIGRAMSTAKSEDEWKDAITTLRNCASEFQGMGDEVLPRLKLSYDNLRNETMKSCFLYCALYPEDHDIYIPRLIDCWIAEGFLNRSDNNLDGARSHGHSVIETLKRACLLEESGFEILFPRKTYVKMHDIIRDLALWIVNDCKSNNTTGKFLVTSNSNVLCERWRNAERIFWSLRRNDDGGINNGWEEPPRSTNLQTLMVYFPGNFQTLFPGNYFSLPQSFFQFTPLLRVLDLTNIIGLTELPTSICQLYELQYLNLSSTKIKEIPIELRKLVELKFLDLSATEDLEKIPPGVIANLSELQVLKLLDSGFKGWGLKEEDGGLCLSEELDRLKQLQEVTLTISTSLALEELLCNQKLTRICTRLKIESCVNLKLISLKGLGNLTSLKDLTIGGCVDLEEIIWGEKYYSYKIPPAPQQQQQHYLPYVSHFQNLHHITIERCDALKELTWLVYVENLNTLVVRECHGLETIMELGDDYGLEGTSGGGGGGVGFGKRLESLTMINLPKLKSICRHALALPSIKTIEVCYCSELKKLPLDYGSNVNNTLQWIKGSPEWLNQLEWEDETIKSKFLLYFQWNKLPWEIEAIKSEVHHYFTRTTSENRAAACTIM